MPGLFQWEIGFMGKIHLLFAVILATCVVSVIMPASAAQGRQTSATTGAVEHSDTVTKESLNRRSLREAQAGKKPGFAKAATVAHQTAQLSRSAKNGTIRRAIAVRRARAAKAKKAVKG